MDPLPEAAVRQHCRAWGDAVRVTTEMGKSMRLKLIAALSGVALASVLVASPSASADKPAKPAESGVVQRKDAIGGHPVGPVMTDVGGTMLPILVVVGWDDAVELCTDMRPVINGVEQIVLAPSGNSSVVVHNSDAPVLVFDVS
ncbi:MAG: hypothetical protein WCA90_10740, partial [Ilumatobacteraceae bacterium]